MLRKTADGKFQRQTADGQWEEVSAQEAGMSETATAVEAPEQPGEPSGGMIEDLAKKLNGSARKAPAQETQPKTPEQAQDQAARVEQPSTVAEGSVGQPGTENGQSSNSFDLDVPGLVSGDGARGSRGFQTVKERLRARKAQARVGKKVEVGAAAAKVQGPAAREGTERRAAKRARERLEAGKQAQVGEAGAKQRYVNRPAPELLSSRPKWVQDLFEAHFRSEHTLGMRRAFNRMKISRSDYAIGWLTAFDKFREEASLLRLKEQA